MSFLDSVLFSPVNRFAEIKLNGDQVLDLYGRIDAPNESVKADLKHPRLENRDFIKTLSAPVSTDVGNIDLGKTISYKEVLDIYQKEELDHLRKLPEFIIQALKSSAEDIVNFVEKLIQGTAQEDFERLQIKIGAGPKKRPSDYAFSLERSKEQDHYLYTLDLPYEQQKLEVVTDPTNAKTIKKIKLYETESPEQDAFELDIDTQMVHHSHLDLDCDLDLGAVPIKRPVKIA